MKKILIFVIIAAFLGFNTIAYADEGSPNVDAGITPDSILYSADKLVEDLQLFFTFDSQKDAELLLQFANERLAEAKEMTVEEKTEFVEAAIKDYTTLMDKAEDKVAEVAADENTTAEVKDGLSQELQNTSQVDEDIQKELDAESQKELEETTSKAVYTANVVKDLDTAVVQALREKGMGFGQIAHTIALSEVSGKTVDEITGMLDSGKGIGEIAKELGLHPSKMNSKKKDEANNDTSTEEPTTSTDENATSESQTVVTADTSTVQSEIKEVTSTDANKNGKGKSDAAKIEKKPITEAVTVTNQEITANDSNQSKNENDKEVKSNDDKSAGNNAVNGKGNSSKGKK